VSPATFSIAPLISPPIKIGSPMKCSQSIRTMQRAYLTSAVACTHQPQDFVRG
jgi:hypothetical protein